MPGQSPLLLAAENSISTMWWSKITGQSNAGSRAMQGFRAFDSARRMIQGSETMNMIRKGHIRWLPEGRHPRAGGIHSGFLRARIRLVKESLRFRPSSLSCLQHFPFASGLAVHRLRKTHFAAANGSEKCTNIRSKARAWK
jgi:hypothetical protein